MQRSPVYLIRDAGLPVPMALAQKIGRTAFWPQWPEPLALFEPKNVWAERMKAYYRGSGRTGLPMSPLHDDEDEIFLPSFSLGDIPVAKAPPGAPLWRRYDGTTFALLAWPSMSHEPLNAAAEQVAAYLEMHRDNPRLAISPWCELRRDVCLPTLPRPKSAARARAAIEQRRAQEAEQAALLRRSERIGRMFETKEKFQ